MCREGRKDEKSSAAEKSNGGDGKIKIEKKENMFVTVGVSWLLVAEVVVIGQKRASWNMV